METQKPDHCGCETCEDGTTHLSDCAVHNEPAYPNGPCDCGAAQTITYPPDMLPSPDEGEEAEVIVLDRLHRLH